MPRSAIACRSRSRSAGGTSPAITGSWAAKSATGRAGGRPAGNYRLVAGKAGSGPAVGALDREILQPRQHLLARGFLAAPPGRDMRHDQGLTEQPPAQARQEPEQRSRLQYAGARHVGDDDAVLAQHIDQTGHAEMRGRIEFERIEKIRIDAAQQHVEPLQPRDGADMNAVAADGEIVTLDQEKAEIARQRGVFEI